MCKAATLVQDSGDSKLSHDKTVSATWVAQVSCPGGEPNDVNPCPFMCSGCYAEQGNCGWTTGRLARAAEAEQADSLACAEAEAELIRKAADTRKAADRPLRLHVVGDSKNDMLASIVSGAADYYRDKTGQPVWTYTHAWRTVDRASWSNVSTLASVETLGDAAEAARRGYAPAVVVDSHSHVSRESFKAAGLRYVPCPNQTKGKTCVECGYCLNDDMLRQHNIVIGFAAHGATKAVKAALDSLV